MNSVCLLGSVTRAPSVRFQPESGQQVVSFTVCVEEPSPRGDPFKTFIGIECYGRSATQAETLEPGTLVTIEGKIGWKRYEHKGEKRTTLVVMARQIAVVARGAPADTHTPCDAT